jgi:iron complex outermembrane recepter protein
MPVRGKHQKKCNAQEEFMRRFLMSTAALVVVASPLPAFAQAAADVDPNEIIVTAQKRPERLKDIPVAASVLSGESVAQQHVTDLSDINRVVPSVEIKGTFNGRVPYGMRGISTNANEGAIGLTSGVSIQIDGIPVPADSFAANTISDVAQLEVLKGPQATLGGRTASAGVINFVTNGPSTTSKGVFGVTITEDGEYRAEMRVSGPITNGVSFSLAGYDSKTPYPVYNTQLKQRSVAKSYGLRGKLKFEIGEDFDATLMGHYALSQSRGENFVYQYITPGAFLLAPPLTQALVLQGYTPYYGNTVYDSPVMMTSRYEDKDGSLVLNYRAGGLTLSSTTSLFQENQYQSQDLFETSVFFFNVLTGGHAPAFNDQQSNQGYVKQTTQEFKIATDNTKPLSALVGAFYSDMTVTGYGLRTFVPFSASAQNTSTTKNYALYGRVTAKFSETLSATGGLRYYKDKIGWSKTQFFNPALPADQAQWQGCGGPRNCTWNLSDSSTGLVGDFALQAHLSQGSMVYASYTRGYKPQAYNTAHDFTSLQSEVNLAAGAADKPFATPTAKEKIDSFEVGLKTSALDNHLSLNLAAFYTNYDGYQAQIFDNSQLIGILVLSNAGARTKGAEADITWHSGGTNLSVAAAYIDAKFRNFAGANCFPTQTVAQGCVAGGQNLSGKSLPASPKFKMNASLQQKVPLDSFDIVLGSNLSYRSSTVLQADGNPQTAQGAFALLDASIGVQTKDGSASLTFFANNITDKFYLTNAEDFFSGPWGANAVIGQPARDSHRYFGARASFKF